VISKRACQAAAIFLTLDFAHGHRDPQHDPGSDVLPSMADNLGSIVRNATAENFE
jgi:hypothetical protein